MRMLDAKRKGSWGGVATVQGVLGQGVRVMLRTYKFESRLTHSLKAPGFQPLNEQRMKTTQSKMPNNEEK
jgi:hypothetical protein